jgi:hypothetical protein
LVEAEWVIIVKRRHPLGVITHGNSSASWTLDSVRITSGTWDGEIRRCVHRRSGVESGENIVVGGGGRGSVGGANGRTVGAPLLQAIPELVVLATVLGLKARAILHILPGFLFLQSLLLLD